MRLSFLANTIVEKCGDFAGSVHGLDFTAIKTISELQVEEYGQFDVIGQVAACDELDNYNKNDKAGKKKPFSLIDVEKRNDGGLEQVLEKGPWMIRNQPLILTKWAPNLELAKDVVKKVPVWVKASQDSESEVEELESGFGTKTDNHKGHALPRMRFSMFSIASWNIKESHVDISALSTVCSKVFRIWDWTSNASLCNKGCRIILGWNTDVVDLGLHKNVVQGAPWILMGDFNVALNMEDNFSGSSSIDSAMCEFKDCVTNIETLKFLILTALVFTLHGTKNREEGMPYRNSDHSPSVLKIPSLTTAKPKPFKFFNFLAYKEGFTELVSNQWAATVEGHMMYQVLDSEDLFHKKVSDLANENMTKPITNEEIKRAMFGIVDDKAPGPDGFTFTFFKKGWDVVGQAICKAVRDFFDNGKLLKEVNHTFLALIPKILTNRIIEGIKEVASDNQSAFVMGRRISNNILITQELMHNYHCDRGPPRGDVNPAKVIMDSLDEFKAVSGLVPIIPKSTATYLKVSLLNKDCKILVEKARNRIGDWKIKSLSFAGRLQFCTSVISSMQVYWASVFVIPKAKVWRLVRGYAKMDTVQPILNDIVLWFQHMGSRRAFQVIVGKLLFDATSYHVWRERNNILFKGTRRSPEELRDLLIVTIRLKMVSFRFKNTVRVQRMLALWKLPTNFRLYGD
ncbi:methylenetetrahydrofolate reductase 1 [Tanacetum coccineum]